MSAGDWFGGDQASDGAPIAEAEQTSTLVAAGEPTEVRAASGPVPDLVAALADAAAPSESTPAPTDPAAESDSRVRLRALTGGLADLSDALAAIGVESVAVRGSHPASPASAAPSPAADFRVRCPDCGPQYVAVADVRFVETGDGAEANRYLFTCPACGARVRRPAGPELAGILKSAGVATLALRRGPGQAL